MDPGLERSLSYFLNRVFLPEGWAFRPARAFLIMGDPFSPHGHGASHHSHDGDDGDDDDDDDDSLIIIHNYYYCHYLLS